MCRYMALPDGSAMDVDRDLVLHYSVTDESLSSVRLFPPGYVLLVNLS